MEVANVLHNLLQQIWKSSLSDNDFLACISKSSLSYFGDEFHQSEKGIFEFNIPDVRSCDNFSVEVDFTLHGNKLTKGFDLNICPYIRPLWHKGSMYCQAQFQQNSSAVTDLALLPSSAPAPAKLGWVSFILAKSKTHHPPTQNSSEGTQHD